MNPAGGHQVAQPHVRVLGHQGVPSETWQNKDEEPKSRRYRDKAACGRCDRDGTLEGKVTGKKYVYIYLMSKKRRKGERSFIEMLSHLNTSFGQ